LIELYAHSRGDHPESDLLTGGQGGEEKIAGTGSIAEAAGLGMRGAVPDPRSIGIGGDGRSHGVKTFGHAADGYGGFGGVGIVFESRLDWSLSLTQVKRWFHQFVLQQFHVAGR